MNSMTTSSQINDLGDFLSKHNATSLGKTSTHTRIKDEGLNIYGGNYSIDKEELPLYYRLYYESVFVKGRKEYLTEAQLKDGTGPLLVDFDFRYDYDVTERQHTIGHIQDVIQLYLEELKELLIFKEKTPFPIFVMEKPHVNRVTEKNLTKDGIHMIFGIQMDHTLQQILREQIIAKLSDIWELPLTNDWANVLDEGITKGKTNWQMYGSQKPGNEAYKLSYYMIAEIDPADNEFMTVPKSVKEFDLSKNLHLLSAQYDQHVKFDMNPKITEKYNKMLTTKGAKKTATSGGKGKVNLVLDEEEAGLDIELSDITSLNILNKAIDNIMASLKINEQYIKETHDYTQVLPAKYYEPGSHLLNRQVAFALKHTDERLFLSWIMLRSKASDFDYSTISKLYNDWKYHFNKKSTAGDGVTRKSIMYWAKQDAFEEYEKVKRSTINSYIEETIFEVGDWDYAMVLFHMFKDRYVCSSLTNKTWYIFNNHRWEEDEGMTLRMAISKDLFQLYSDKQAEYLSDMQSFKENEDHHEIVQKKIKKIAEICIKLKKTGDKNNIMREAMEIFFDKNFVRNMDANPYLMCFTNGVVDFKSKTFRHGYPQDYITKTTGIPYVPLNNEMNGSTINELCTFMEQLFPQKDLCRYMWDHLAATLIGIKKEHAFNIYRGSGSNGKSILTELMSQSLGDYKGTVPITLVTEKRNAIGGTSSEIIQLKGVRYAVMQEPSKDAVINEGIMKELTGGDPIQARALFCSSEIFIPQFSLVVCTNALFEVRGGDDGTWRRMKLVDFISKFVSDGETHTDDTKHVFPKDKGLKEKLPSWAIVFMSMLVKRAFETNGEVVDCEEVKAASNKYRQSQDCIAGFIADNIEKVPGAHLGKKLLNSVFKEWFQLNYSGRKIPKLMELEEAMDKRFDKKSNKSGAKEWIDIKIKSDDGEDDILDEF